MKTRHVKHSKGCAAFVTNAICDKKSKLIDIKRIRSTILPPDLYMSVTGLLRHSLCCPALSSQLHSRLSRGWAGGGGGCAEQLCWLTCRGSFTGDMTIPSVWPDKWRTPPTSRFKCTSPIPFIRPPPLLCVWAIRPGARLGSNGASLLPIPVYILHLVSPTGRLALVCYTPSSVLR